VDCEVRTTTYFIYFFFVFFCCFFNIFYTNSYIYQVLPHILKYVLNFVISPLKTNLCLSMLGNTQNRVVLASFILFPSPKVLLATLLPPTRNTRGLWQGTATLLMNPSFFWCALKGKSINCILYMPLFFFTVNLSKIPQSINQV